MEQLSYKRRIRHSACKLDLDVQEHIEGYHELSAKTKSFFSTAVAKWDADFYVKIDDDVHVNLGMLQLLSCYSFYFCENQKYIYQD